MAPNPISETGCCDPSRGGGEFAAKLPPPHRRKYHGLRPSENKGLEKKMEYSTVVLRKFPEDGESLREFEKAALRAGGVLGRFAAVLDCLDDEAGIVLTGTAP